MRATNLTYPRNAGVFGTVRHALQRVGHGLFKCPEFRSQGLSYLTATGVEALPYPLSIQGVMKESRDHRLYFEQVRRCRGESVALARPRSIYSGPCERHTTDTALTTPDKLELEALTAPVAQQSPRERRISSRPPLACADSAISGTRF